MGAVVIYAMFAAVDTTGDLRHHQRHRALDGRRLDGRHRRRAGRPADDRRRVRPQLRRHDRHLRPALWPAHHRVRHPDVARHPASPSPSPPCVGLVNGWLVMLTGLPSFIVTLAMFFSLRGINLGVTKYLTDTVRVAGVDDVDGFDSAAKIFASTFWEPYNFRIAVVWWIGITLIATTVLTKTRFGNWIYAVGGDQNAARNTGVPVRRTKITLFVCTSMAAALVGIISPDPAALDAGRSRGRRGVHLHHRRGRRRLPADRRLRLGDRREHRRLDHRHGLHRHRVCRLEHRLVLAVPRRDPLRRGAGQHLHQQARQGGKK